MTKTKAFLTSDNQVFLTREDAQRHELQEIFSRGKWPTPTSAGEDADAQLSAHAASVVFDLQDHVLSALATRKPRAPKTKPAKKLKATPASEPKFSGPVHAT